jgi:hypothetical protein
MAVFWADTNSIDVRVYNGSELEPTIPMGGTIRPYDFTTMVEGERVHVGFLDGDNDLAYDVFNSTSDSWAGQTTLESGVNDNLIMMSLSLHGSDVYYFYTNETSDYIHYLVYNGSWSNIIDWIDETSETIPQADSISSYDVSIDGRIGIVYVTNASTPRILKYANLTIPPIGITISNDLLESNQTNVYDLEVFELNITISFTPNTENFSRNILIIDPESLAMNITYLNGTGFSELSDPSDYISLDVGASYKTDISSTSFNLTYVLFIRPTITREGWFNITSFTNETGGVSDSDLFVNVFNLTIRNPTMSPTLLFGAGFNESTPRIEIHWTYSGSLVTDYEVQNSTDIISWTSLAYPIITSYNDTSPELNNGTYRYHRVRARRTTGVGYKNSSWSNVNLEQVYFVSGVVSGTGLKIYPLFLYIIVSIIVIVGASSWKE